VAKPFAQLLDTLRRLARGVAPSSASIDLPDEEALKLQWLAAGGRDMEAMTVPLAREMGKAYARGLLDLATRKTRDTSHPWVMACEVYRDALAQRLLTGGGDIKRDLRPLRPSTIERKGHARIGYDTGDLWRAVKSGRIVVRRGDR
jgi:hypothetical protein